MIYRIQDAEKAFEGRIAERLGGGDYVIEIDGKRHELKILEMSARQVEFVLDREYHRAKYLGNSTSEMSLVIDNVPMLLGKNTHFDGIVYKNSGGKSAGTAQPTLKSQIPGKVVSIAVAEGGSVAKGDVVCTLESMKMQVAVKSHKDGTVKSLKIKEAATVAKGDVIAEID